MSDKPIEEMTFEQAMAELEAVVDQLDRGDVALDESIKLYAVSYTHLTLPTKA